MIRLVILLIILPITAVAEPVAIRSGEHETFSRLVLKIGTGTNWTLTSVEEGFELTLSEQTDGFDTTEVFERIPRRRLTNLTQVAPDTLRLSVGCSCASDAFLWRPGQLVVDIIDASTSEAIGASPQTTSLPVDMTLPQDTPLSLPNMLVLVSPTSLDPTVNRPDAQLVPAEIDLSATEVALAEGIARAASHGFLVPNVVQPTSPDLEEESDDSAEAVQPVPTERVQVGRPGVGISTAMDRDLARLSAALERSIDQHCLQSDLFQIDVWGDARAFHDQVSARAEALAGEFGEEPREAEEQLARLYIHFGFGAEAKAVLATDIASSLSRSVLAELAGIVDDYDGEYPLVQAQTGCETPGALWAFLIHPTALDHDTRNDLVQQFFVLPQPLRSQIAPRLARGFVEVGEPDAAGQLLHSADNTDAETTHDVQSTRALIAEEFDDRAGATRVLAKEANDNARTTPQSLIRLIELELEQGNIPSEADMLLAASLRQEYRGTPIEQALADIEAKGRIANAQYQAALDLVHDRNDTASAVIVDAVFRDMTARATAGVFLEFVYGDVPNGLTSQTENAIARRLIDLGFPDRADVFLVGAAEQEAAAQRRYLRAEAAIGTGDFFQVIEVLRGMTDNRARTLRARAYEGLGEFRSALSSLTPTQDASTAVLQFRANAWERLTVDQDEVLSSFAQAVLEPAVEGQIVTLADRRVILMQSQESRRAIEQLLLRFDGTSAQN